MGNHGLSPGGKISMIKLDHTVLMSLFGGRERVIGGGEGKRREERMRRKGERKGEREGKGRRYGQKVRE